jgi:hypothetical protein
MNSLKLAFDSLKLLIKVNENGTMNIIAPFPFCVNEFLDSRLQF